MAVDALERANDWVFVSVRSAVVGERLGDASRLTVEVFDSGMRMSMAQRVARNVDILVRGVSARDGSLGPEVIVTEVSEVLVGSQRILKAFGLLSCKVGLVARENVLGAKSETFLPDLTQVLRAVFAFFRLECGERGMRDVGGFLRGEEMCRQVLRKFSSVPAVSREVKYRQCAWTGSGWPRADRVSSGIACVTDRDLEYLWWSGVRAGARNLVTG